MEHGQKLYAAKTVSWPGATPFFPPVCGPNPFGASGVAPGHDARAQLARSVFCRVRALKVRSQTERAHRVIADGRYRLTTYCPSLTTFSTTFLSTKPSEEVELCVETLIPPMVPLRVPLPAPANACKPR